MGTKDCKRIPKNRVLLTFKFLPNLKCELSHAPVKENAVTIVIYYPHQEVQSNTQPTVPLPVPYHEESKSNSIFRRNLHPSVRHIWIIQLSNMT